MPRLPRTMAEWERSQEGDPAAQARAENIKNTFFGEALRLRYGATPSQLDWAGLALLGRQALDASSLYWGPPAETEPDHLHLRFKILEQLRAVEERIVAPPLPAADTAATGPVSKKAWVNDAWEIALEILTDPVRRAKLTKKRYLNVAALAREVGPELRARGYPLPDLTIEKSLRLGVREWERQNPDGRPESRPE